MDSVATAKAVLVSRWYLSGAVMPTAIPMTASPETIGAPLNPRVSSSASLSWRRGVELRRWPTSPEAPKPSSS